jgi:8-oxo-dGTP diphosphatase
MSQPTNHIAAGGGLILRQHHRKGLQVLICYRRRYDDWSLPKGKLDPGEGILGAALREVEEETGFRCAPIAHHGKVEYTLKSGTDKVVDYWTMEPISGSFSPNDEIQRVKWLTLADAVEALSYKHDRRLVKDVSASWAVDHPVLYLVRHAHAGDRATYEGTDDTRRPLSVRGWAQVEGITKLLHHRGITRLITSPYVRCFETLLPLSEKLGVAIEPHGALAEEASYSDVADLVDEVRGERAALCSHGNIIPAALQHLERTGTQMVDPFDCKKGSIWVATTPEGQQTQARYVPPTA